MEERFDWRRLISKMARWSPLAWAIIFIAIAFGLVMIETDITRKLAILPAIIGLFLFYQAIFKGKIY